MKLFGANARHLVLNASEATPATSDAKLNAAKKLAQRFARVSGWWDLTRQEEAALLGIPENALPLKLGAITPALQARLAGLVRVWLDSRRGEIDQAWLRRQSNLLDGLSPLQAMAQRADGIERVLDALTIGPDRDR